MRGRGSGSGFWVCGGRDTMPGEEVVSEVVELGVGELFVWEREDSCTKYRVCVLVTERTPSMHRPVFCRV